MRFGEMVHISRLVRAGSSVARWICTAAADVKAAEKLWKPRNEGSLYKRLSALGATGGSVAKTLNEYIREGKVARKIELDRCINGLRKFHRYQHALEVMQWMEMRGINFANHDRARRLDLISKTQGIAAAENYFSDLPPTAKNKFTYGALLNCYCTEKMTDQAVALFKKMDEMNITSTLAFNNLMTLCMRLGQPEKVPPLIDTMKEKKIPLATFSYIILMQSYSCLNDIEAVERVFKDMQKENGEVCDWTIYSNLASSYIKAGHPQKAQSALKAVEEVMRPHDRTAYHFLISLYAGISNLDEVHRIWNSLKSSFQATPNASYLVMLHALVRLNDIDGLRRCFDEWESSCTLHDNRLIAVVLRAYLTNGMIGEATSVFRRLTEKSKGTIF